MCNSLCQAFSKMDACSALDKSVPGGGDCGSSQQNLVN